MRKLLNAERANKKLREEIAQLLNEKARLNTKTKPGENGMEDISCGCCSCDEAENSSDGGDRLETMMIKFYWWEEVIKIYWGSAAAAAADRNAFSN